MMDLFNMLRRRQEGLSWTKGKNLFVDELFFKNFSCIRPTKQTGVRSSVYSAEPPTYALGFCPVPSFENILTVSNETGIITLIDASLNQGFPPKIVNAVKTHNNAVFDFSWMKNELKFVTASGDQTACLWDAGSTRFEKISTFREHTSSVKSVEFSPVDQNVFVTASRDNSICLWDVRSTSSRPENRIRGAHHTCRIPRQGRHSGSTPSSSSLHQVKSSVTCAIFRDQVELISSGDNDGLIKVWDLRKHYSSYRGNSLPKHFMCHPGGSSNFGISSLVLASPGDIYLYANCLNDRIYKYDLVGRDPGPVASYRGFENRSFFVKASLSPDGTYLVSGSSDGRAVVWNTNYPGEPLAELRGFEAEVTCVSWDHSGRVLASCSDDVDCRIWYLAPPSGFPADEDLIVASLADLSLRRHVIDVSASDLDSTPSKGERLVLDSQQTPTSNNRNVSPVSKTRAASASTGKKRKAVVCKTPSILDFFPTPTRESGGESSPKSARLSIESGSPDRRGLKRRLTDSMDSKENSPLRKTAFSCSTVSNDFNTKKDKSDDDRSEARLNTLQTLDGNELVVADRSGTSNPAALPCDKTPSKIREKKPLDSPTANLPNLIADGTSPHLPEKAVSKRKTPSDWLSNFTLKRKKALKYDETK